MHRARGSIPAALWDTRDLSRAVLQDTTSFLPPTKPEVPSENISCRSTPEHRLDSAASQSSSLPHSTCTRPIHRHPQAWAPRLGCSQQQAIPQLQWLLFQWNFQESRCTDPPESSRTLVLQQDHCVMLVQQRIADVFAVSGMDCEIQCWPFPCSLVQATLIVFPLLFFFYFLRLLGDGDFITSVHFSSSWDVFSLLCLAAAFSCTATRISVHQLPGSS